ncbi:DUF983 domain-containing protein [Taibaiella chishuiensis]|uniref:Uncharacterized protein DUF983 n=1 Tax=Taibaiella chishuiensis TaxID=1434707 RepID=A0A2P8D8K9_9BACT|nr:uncharacterized protein DUF983 [Taibaiella chishuiensis]
MSRRTATPLLLPALLREKCPGCRRGSIFINSGILPLRDCLKTREHCPVCGQKIKVENNYGQGMNFVFIVVIFILTAIGYHLLIGLSFKDNSIYYYVALSVLMVIFLQPWLMRLSRVLFLYLVVPYRKDRQ